MDKAIEIIRDYMKIVTTVSTQYHVSECKEAIAELQAHKANIEEIATDLQNISQYLKEEVHPRCEYDLYSRLEDLNGAVLQKLEELDK